MTLFTNILYWISTSLLIPIIVFLLLAFVKSLLMLGGFYGLYMSRLRFKKNADRLLNHLKREGAKKIDFAGYIQGKSLFLKYLKTMIDVSWHPVHCEKAVSDFEIEGEKELEISKTLMRIGPMLGLMGTLIPMGPALTGLAAGDIASMALNMQVAFSTTVVGIFIGAIGFVTQLVKQRWFAEDLNNLQYVYELARSEDR